MRVRVRRQAKGGEPHPVERVEHRAVVGHDDQPACGLREVQPLAPGATDTEALGLQGFDAAKLPSVMPPAEVARQALRELGRTPLHVPGADNRKLVNQLRRMPRRRQLEFNAANMAAALSATGRPVHGRH